MIVIVGLGALGSHVALLLRSFNLKLVDFDRVEQKNILAQFHGKMGLGMNKASAMGRALQGMFGTKAEVVPHKLTGDNAYVILKGSELVLDCTDNITARLLISTACRKFNLPCLHGCLAASGDFARIVWEEAFVADKEGDDAKATCVDGEHLPFYAASAAFMALEAQRYLTTKKRSNFQLSPTSIMKWTS